MNREDSIPGRSMHLVASDSLGGMLRSAGARSVLVTNENLTWGPTAIDVAHHLSVRRRFWERVYGATLTPSRARLKPLTTRELRRALRDSGNLPVVIWSSDAWADVLHEWWALNAITKLGFAKRRIVIASPPSGRLSAAARPPQHVPAMLAAAAPVDRARLRSSVALWRAFTNARPGPLSRLLAHHDPARKRLVAELARVHPRPSGGAGRTLPEVDRTLLDLLPANDWCSVADILRHHRGRVMPLLRVYGDLFVTFRLSELARQRAVERRVVRAPGAIVPSLVFRLTPRGMAMLGAAHR